MMSIAYEEQSNHGSSVQQEISLEQDGGKASKPKTLHGRAFYESLGSPRFVLAPMVDQSEFVILASPSKDTLLIMLTTGMASPHPLIHEPFDYKISSCIHANAALPNVHRNGQVQRSPFPTIKKRLSG
jgi:hypothetical protein